MDEFETFIRNNYYDPLTPDKWLDMYEEWLDNNVDASDDFGYFMGETFAQDVIDQAGLSDEDFWVLDVLADHCHLVYDSMLYSKYYGYLVRYFADHLKNQTTKPYDSTQSDDGINA